MEPGCAGSCLASKPGYILDSAEVLSLLLTHLHRVRPLAEKAEADSFELSMTLSYSRNAAAIFSPAPKTSPIAVAFFMWLLPSQSRMIRVLSNCGCCDRHCQRKDATRNKGILLTCVSSPWLQLCSRGAGCKNEFRNKAKPAGLINASSGRRSGAVPICEEGGLPEKRLVSFQPCSGAST